MAAAGDPDRQTLRPARRLLAGRDLGDRRRGDDQHLQRQRPAGGAARPQPRRQHDAGRERAHAQPRTVGGQRRRLRSPSPSPASSLRTAVLARTGAQRRKRRRRANPKKPPDDPRSAGARSRPDQARLRRLAGQLRLRRRLRQRRRRCPTWRAPCAPRACCSSDYSLLDKTALPNSIAAISGQPPNAETKADCPTYDEFPAGATANSRAIVSAAAASTRSKPSTFADQLIGAQLNWHAYMESMVDPKPASPTTASTPNRDAPRPPATGGYAASSTRSSTSTRCSTSATARPTTCR